MKPTSSTHPWRTWYDRSLTSRGKDGQCLSALSPERPTLFGDDGAGDQLHELNVASKGAAWPAPSIWCVLAVGMAAARERVRRRMLLGLRAP